MQFTHADHRPGYNKARYYAIQITASQCLDKLCDAYASVTLGCILAALSLCISETVQQFETRVHSRSRYFVKVNTVFQISALAQE